MIIQIYGTKKCTDSQKAVRFFKERKIQIQFIDLKEKGMSKGEIQSVSRSVPLKELIDLTSKIAIDQGLAMPGYSYDITEKLMENPLLFKTPVVRCGQKACAGYKPEIWLKFAELEGK